MRVDAVSGLPAWVVCMDLCCGLVIVVVGVVIVVVVMRRHVWIEVVGLLAVRWVCGAVCSAVGCRAGLAAGGGHCC